AGRIIGKEPKPDEGFTVLELNEFIVGDVRTALLVLLGAVTLVLLIATANIANLFLARMATREKEIAIRTALGAGRGRLLRQLLTESLLLAAAGGAFGLLFAMWGTDLFLSLCPQDIPRLHEVGMDWCVAARALLSSISSSIIFGLAPALQSSRSNLAATLKEGGRSSSESGGGRRLRDLLVVAETALALTLLAGAGLLVKSFLLLRNVDAGFNKD